MSECRGRGFRGRLAGLVAILGGSLLAFVLGAGVMSLHLPPFHFLDEAFRGGDALFRKEAARRQERNTLVRPALSPDTDQPRRTCDGFNLFCTVPPATAVLVNMKGVLVHEWKVPFRQVWPNPTHIKDPVRDDQVYYSDCRLFPNGDLLVVFQGDGDTPYGYGMAKVDKNSKVLWKFADHVHHEADIGEDGKVYALTQKFIHQAPPGLEWIPTPSLVDDLVVLSPEGQELQRVPILETLADSPYRLLLDDIRNMLEAVRKAKKGGGVLSNAAAHPTDDILHTNAVRVLSAKLAPKFPLFKAGQVLISIRDLNILAVLDLESAKPSIVWASRGPWRAQHSPRLLDNGHVLLLDNSGVIDGSRVLEFDPQTQGFPWSAPKVPSAEFRTSLRGAVSRLPNGNTFVVDSDGRRLRELAPDGDLVWSLRTPVIPCSGMRYMASQLDADFLQGCRAR